MNKYKVIMLALFAVFAFSAVAAASASATDEWLVNSELVALTGKISLVTSGTWKLTAEGFGGLGKMEVECNGQLIGTVNGLNGTTGKGTDTITEIANLTLSETGTITCTIGAAKGPCTSTTARFTAEHLPWLSELILKTGNTKPTDLISSDGLGPPAFNIECAEGAAKTFKELCEGNIETDELVNEAGGTVSGAILNKPTSNCKDLLSNAKISAKGIITTLSGLSLAVS